MSYLRKGGRGLANASPRRRYNYYQKRAQERLIMEEAFASATRRRRPDEFEIRKLFKPQTYDELFEKGITRKINGDTVRIKGIRAIEIKTQSYKAFASKSEKAKRFIDNYIQGMKNSEYPYDDLDYEEARRLLESISTDALSLAIRKDIIRPITFVYAEPKSVMRDLRDAIKMIKGKEFKQELKEVRELAKEYKPVVEKEYALLFSKRFM